MSRHEWKRVTARTGGSTRQYARGSGTAGPLDAYGLLKTILDSWQEAFAKDLPRAVRNHVGFALDGRNSLAHAAGAIDAVEALRTLDAMAEVLKAARATGPAAQVRTLHAEQARELGPAAAAAAEPQPNLIEPTTPQRLRSWRDVVNPHPDVLENRFKQSEFAADLTAVDLGRAAPEYLNPADFFRISFLTEGIKKVLTLAAERLAGSGGEPVIGLQTAFGGGKTHTMLAIWHLAGVSDPRSLAGADAVVSEAIARAWKPAQRYVLVGTGIGAKAMPNNERIGWGEQRASANGVDSGAETQRLELAHGRPSSDSRAVCRGWSRPE